ncbi:MAG: metallophosphoesterase [Gammaproteobacteria bacterium]
MRNAREAGYDIIGDVHGCHEELTKLLSAMGYRKRAGVWRHPSRLAVFVGDLIDRGPEIEAVLETVAAMVEAGSAECILGNHERDLVYFHTLNAKGKPMRERSESRMDQLKATHGQLGMKSRKLRRWVRWMRDLPIVFERPGLRVVHGAWHEPAVTLWRGKALSSRGMLKKLANRQSQEAAHLAMLLFGPVISFKMRDSKGNKRMYNLRARWFCTPEELSSPTLWHAAFHRRKRWPRSPLSDADRTTLWGYPKSEPPLVTGHQSLGLEASLRPFRSNLACVDYSAVYGGKLCAYRWSGEQALTRKHFVAVAARRPPRKPRAPKVSKA